MAPRLDNNVSSPQSLQSFETWDDFRSIFGKLTRSRNHHGPATSMPLSMAMLVTWSESHENTMPWNPQTSIRNWTETKTWFFASLNGKKERTSR